MNVRLVRVVMALCVMFVGCGDEGTSDEDPQDAMSTNDGSSVGIDGGSEPEGDTSLSTDDGMVTPAEDTSEAATGDAAVDEEQDAPGPPPDVAPDVDSAEPQPSLLTRMPLAKPTDPLAGSAVESCGVYEETQCVDGVSHRCDIYDPSLETFVAEPDPVLRRVLLYDRWRDLYNSPDGMAVDRDFVNETVAGTPEETWGSPDNFKCYCGSGDGGIWTGWSLASAALRYSQTGTQADYERMEWLTRSLLMMFDVSGMKGYISRYHYLLLPDGAPTTDQHITRHGSPEGLTHRDRTFDPATVPDAPAIYTEGLVDEDGVVWQGTPMWHGRPSIDQNTGPMVAFPMVYGLLEDESVKDRIREHLTCYLKRLERIEIINLQQNQEAVSSLLGYFNAGELKLDPDDIDLAGLDRIVAFAHRQINSLNEDSFDQSCPDTVFDETPWRVLDAADPLFALDMIELALDFDAHENERANGINHIYVPTLRGGDAMHMMHLATIAFHMTGDPDYKTFLFEELIGNLQADQVAFTTGAFNLPHWCKKWYGDQITYGPWWAFLHLLDESPLLSQMQQAFHLELWDKVLRFSGNTDFEIMYAGAIPDDIADDKVAVLGHAIPDLLSMGGNGGVLDDPRRTYTRPTQSIIDQFPDGTALLCPTDAQREMCEQDLNVLGATLPGASISFECSDATLDCEMSDGVCTTAIANKALPIMLRSHSDFIWQRDPFNVGTSVHMEGWRQYSGNDLSEPYWNARRYGFLTEGSGQVLAWRDEGTTCE